MKLLPISYRHGNYDVDTCPRIGKTTAYYCKDQCDCYRGLDQLPGTTRQGIRCDYLDRQIPLFEAPPTRPH